MPKFEIVLKNEKIKLYNRISFLAITINGLIFLYFCFASSYKQIILLSAAGVLIILSGFFLIYKFYKTKPKWKVVYIIIFDLLMVIWVLIGNYWAAGTQLVLSFLFQVATRKLLVSFFENRIIFHSFPERTIQWTGVNNVILKDDLLTIDFKNNKIIQQLIKETDEPVNEKEFNDFCKERLKSEA